MVLTCHLYKTCYSDSHHDETEMNKGLLFYAYDDLFFSVNAMKYSSDHSDLFTRFKKIPLAKVYCVAFSLITNTSQSHLFAMTKSF